jgi:cytochrome c oxidase cbb3-type subunit IV
MTYETMQALSALAGLILFVTLFAGVLLYVFWPGNSQGFEEASRIPFEKDDQTVGGDNGR